MKSYMSFIIIIIILALIVVGIGKCGPVQKLWDTLNYKSITGEVGNITLIHPGGEKEVYENVKIIYSDADSYAIQFRAEDAEKDTYWQGVAKFELK